MMSKFSLHTKLFKAGAYVSDEYRIDDRARL